MSELVHIASPVVTIGKLMRQRCLWCGALLLDYDLERLMVELPIDGSPPSPVPTWEPGSLIAVDGEFPKATWQVMSADEVWGCPGHEHAAELPASSCVKLDPAVTA